MELPSPCSGLRDAATRYREFDAIVKYPRQAGTRRNSTFDISRTRIYRASLLSRSRNETLDSRDFDWIGIHAQHPCDSLRRRNVVVKRPAPENSQGEVWIRADG